MKRKYIFFLVTLTLVLSLGFYALFSQQRKQLIKFFNQETSLLQANSAERFRLLLDSHRAMGIMSADFFSAGKINPTHYEIMATNILQNYEEIMAFNIVDQKGVIVQIFPIAEFNKRALGKRSQYYASYLESTKKGQPFWLSPPFPLYQGEVGFVFYMPIRVNGDVMGWVAPVISQQKFFKQFIHSKLLDSYHLIIQDIETKRNYFSTAQKLPEHGELFIKKRILWGRQIAFISWPKNPPMTEYFFICISILIGLIISALATYAIWLFDQKAAVRNKLHSLSSLLRLTVEDTSNSLYSIHNQLNVMKVSPSATALERVTRHVSYISNLLRQIEMLQNLPGQEDKSKFTSTPILPMLLELSELFQDRINEKKLTFSYDPEEVARIEVRGNRWLLCHCIFGYYLRQAIKFASPGTDIEFRSAREDNSFVFYLQHSGTSFSEDLINGKSTEEESYVAEKVMTLHQGKLSFTNTSKGGMVTIRLPVS